MTALSININKIALLRNSRPGNYPDVAAYAEKCINLGADGITVHPRPDQRHIRPNDVRDISKMISELDGVELNVEGNPFADQNGDYPGLLKLVKQTRPDQCTLVPDGLDQLTSDHGFDLDAFGKTLKPIMEEIKSFGTRVSLFLDPDPHQIQNAAKLGADRIELYTGPYASAWGSNELRNIHKQHARAAKLANSLGLGVNAGHDLNLENLAHYATIEHLLEVSIGHAFTVDSLYMGLRQSMDAYLSILSRPQDC